MNGFGKDRPILRLIVSASDSADDKRLHTALVEMAGRDQSISINSRPEANAYTLAGNTKSHLESICDRLRDEYHLAIDAGPFEAVLIETIRKQAEAEGKYIRQTGGSGNYGHCKIRIEPNDSGEGYEFVNDTKGVVPQTYIKPIDEGIQSAMALGILAGFPMVDVKVTLFDGSYHEVDSNEMAFKFAGSIALKEAARKASPVLLEPVMAVEINVPEELTAAISHQVHAHRGRFERKQTLSGFSEIKAIVPLSELLALASKGLAEFPMEFAGYEPVSYRGPSDENAAGVTANKPNRPRPSGQSEMARPDPEDD
jgi:elongation factor G